MTRDFFDPTPEDQIVVLIETDDLRKVEQLIVGCEGCSEDAEIPFDNLLDRELQEPILSAQCGVPFQDSAA